MKKLRESKGIKANFVASKLGISRDRLVRIEKGLVTLPTEFIPTLAELYGVSNDEIIKMRLDEWKK